MERNNNTPVLAPPNNHPTVTLTNTRRQPVGKLDDRRTGGRKPEEPCGRLTPVVVLPLAVVRAEGNAVCIVVSFPTSTSRRVNLGKG